MSRTISAASCLSERNHAVARIVISLDHTEAVRSVVDHSVIQLATTTVAGGDCNRDSSHLNRPGFSGGSMGARQRRCVAGCV
jgi:hypothetical protein